MLRRSIAALAFGLLLSTPHCTFAADDQPGMAYDLWLGAGLDTRQEGLVLEAVSAWTLNTGVELSVHKATAGDCPPSHYTMCITGVPISTFAAIDGRIGDTTMFTDMSSNIRLVNDRYLTSAEDFDYVELAEHEIGHGLGLHHLVSDGDKCAANVMNWKLDGAFDLSEADINEFWEVRRVADKYTGHCSRVEVDDEHP